MPAQCRFFVPRQVKIECNSAAVIVGLDRIEPAKQAREIADAVAVGVHTDADERQ
jgi:hypothetical protein